MKQRKANKTYTPEFKQEAVRLMKTSDRPAAQIARELGAPRNRLYKWKEQLALKGGKAFSGAGRPRKEDQLKRGQIPIFSNIRRNWDLTPFFGNKPYLSPHIVVIRVTISLRAVTKKLIVILHHPYGTSKGDALNRYLGFVFRPTRYAQLFDLPTTPVDNGYFSIHVDSPVADGGSPQG